MMARLLLLLVLCVLLFGIETFAYGGGGPYRTDSTLLALTETGQGISFGRNLAPDYLKD